MKKIITHDGVFHADEVMAVGLLELFPSIEFAVVRTRESQHWENVSKDTFVIDVGGKFDGKNFFDHHQTDVPPSEKGLSSAGMVYKYLINEYIHSSGLDKLIAEIDQQDTGVKRQSPEHFSNIINGMNTPDIYSETQDKAFRKAVNLSKQLILVKLANCEQTYTDILKKQKKINEENSAKIDEKCQILADSFSPVVFGENKGNTELLNLPDDEYWHITGEYRYPGISAIIIPKETMFIPIKHFIGRADVLIQWDKQQSAWTVQTIPLKQDNFESRISLSTFSPSLRNKAYTPIFVHKAGFIGKYPEVNGKILIKVRDGGLIPSISINI